MLWVLIRIASWGDSNEYPQHMFLWRNKQNYPFIIMKYPPLTFHWRFHKIELIYLLCWLQNLGIKLKSILKFKVLKPMWCCFFFYVAECFAELALCILWSGVLEWSSGVEYWSGVLRVVWSQILEQKILLYFHHKIQKNMCQSKKRVIDRFGLSNLQWLFISPVKPTVWFQKL